MNELQEILLIVAKVPGIFSVRTEVQEHTGINTIYFMTLRTRREDINHVLTLVGGSCGYMFKKYKGVQAIEYSLSWLE